MREMRKVKVVWLWIHILVVNKASITYLLCKNTKKCVYVNCKFHIGAYIDKLFYKTPPEQPVYLSCINKILISIPAELYILLFI